jgi:aryl-alcohol dehydrogenase-like predicted oxidoreductase
MEAFADVVRQGKALYIGVSEWNAAQLREGHRLARQLRIPFVSNQPQYNMLWLKAKWSHLSRARHGQIVWSPIAQGVLTGKYRPGCAPPEGSRATDHRGGADMIGQWLKKPVLAAEEAGLSMAQLAVTWVHQNPDVSAAIIGASRPEQVTEKRRGCGGQARPRSAGRY